MYRSHHHLGCCIPSITTVSVQDARKIITRSLPLCRGDWLDPESSGMIRPPVSR
ncbi:MAG: hypothetical protein QNK37_33765 [Acidobacteriota bacterium]|nr:hypothetical protein [Acidobacteriota bacterium]